MVNTDNFLPYIMFTFPHESAEEPVTVVPVYQAGFKLKIMFNVALEVDNRTETVPRTLLQKVEFLEHRGESIRAY